MRSFYSPYKKGSLDRQTVSQEGPGSAQVAGKTPGAGEWPGTAAAEAPVQPRRLRVSDSPPAELPDSAGTSRPRAVLRPRGQTHAPGHARQELHRVGRHSLLQAGAPASPAHGAALQPRPFRPQEGPGPAARGLWLTLS